MEEPLEDLYFKWLYAKVCDPLGEPEYYDLMHILHSTEFFWFVCGDDNRAEDGIQLREEFLSQANGEGLYDNCSVLEMLIAFSRKVAFDLDSHPAYWFWEALGNLGLRDLSDDTDLDKNTVANILDIFVHRTYDPSGQGGLFPLRDPEHDQRFIEIWYQFSEYLYQNDI